MMTAMAEGKIARVEELTRIPSEVQDTLITLLSEKTLPIRNSATRFRPTRGFNVIATANDRDRGVNELSSALRRRFNTVVLPLPATIEEEVDIVQRRATSMGRALGTPGRTASPGGDPPRRNDLSRTALRRQRDGKPS